MRTTRDSGAIKNGSLCGILKVYAISPRAAEWPAFSAHQKASFIIAGPFDRRAGRNRRSRAGRRLIDSSNAH
ncbi:hypothetical protein EVAR_22822_1 [Eumeta japonica]|uniref:Uncharacterized protein n=1 Tax=Eumeta variegata TaxID=151549 RepID=A0A4C1VFJ2_EUMVA|nr:hypothetical protein EVAR_22822_1 [Eumeta japonica]